MLRWNAIRNIRADLFGISSTRRFSTATAACATAVISATARATTSSLVTACCSPTVRRRRRRRTSSSCMRMCTLPSMLPASRSSTTICLFRRLIPRLCCVFWLMASRFGLLRAASMLLQEQVNMLRSIGQLTITVQVRRSWFWRRPSS